MSKFIKQMEMNALRETFQDVRDLVVLSVKGLNCHAEHTLRSTLRKKKIRLKQVKNSLTRRVFGRAASTSRPTRHTGPARRCWRGAPAAWPS